GWCYELLPSVEGKRRVRFTRPPSGGKKEAGEVENHRIYEINADEIDEKRGTQTLISTFESGILAVPFKFRPKVPNAPSQLTGSGTVGTAFTLRARADWNTELAPIVFLGLSQVALQQDEGAAAKEVPALTLAWGLQVEIVGRTKLGVVMGW